MKTLKILIFVFIVSITSVVQAQTPPIDENGLAIGGYDAVAYFSGEAKKGLETYATKHKEATYQFSSEENLEAFKKNPSQYLPQFDGYCAWGVGAKNTKFPINPETFDIVDGKLYLFFNGPFNGETFNTLTPWNADTTNLMTKAHANWEKL